MVVYRRTNTKNGKVYIGKTTRTADERWASLLYEINRGSHAPIHNAIRKYGSEAFKTDILYEARTYEELSKMETFFIVLHQSHLRENGYNLTLGGDGAAPGELNPMWGKTHTDEVKAMLRALRLGTTQTEETKRKISESERGDKNPFFGKTHIEENRRIYAENARKQMLGIKRSAETKRKMKQAALGVPKSLAHCAAISAAKRGKPGHVPSAAGIERIREAKRQWWAAKREAKGLSPLLSTL
jgi:group I intron endonuclease